MGLVLETPASSSGVSGVLPAALVLQYIKTPAEDLKVGSAAGQEKGGAQHRLNLYVFGRVIDPKLLDFRPGGQQPYHIYIQYYCIVLTPNEEQGESACVWFIKKVCLLQNCGGR